MFTITFLGSNAHPVVIEDITVVYSRYRGGHFSSGTSCSFCNDIVVYLCFVSLADTTKKKNNLTGFDWMTGS